MLSYVAFIIFSVQVVAARVLMWMCHSEFDCLEGYSCHEKVCKKCLKCDMLFRKGNSCVTDFLECGECLIGYEEVLITDYSSAIKPCKPLKKVKSNKCTSDSSCPQNNYCEEESCVKCFDCSLVNRLAPKDNCARSLNECGFCLSGFYEVAVTTNLNFKPCENTIFVIPEMADTYHMSFSNIASISLLLIAFLGVILSLVFINFKGNIFHKAIYRPPVYPSAPPLYSIDAPQNVEKLEETKSSVTIPVEAEKQQARVFKQPDAVYYYAGEEGSEFNDLPLTNSDDTASRSSSWISVTGGQMVEFNCTAGVLIHRYLHLGSNDALTNTSSQQLNEIDISESVSLTIDSISGDVINIPEVADVTINRSDDTVDQAENPNPVKTSVKCRKCRHLLFFHPEVTLFNGHGQSYSNPSVKYISCGTIQEDNIWFLQDAGLPQWISDVVNNSNWTKGKVNCPNCQGRLGSFDFVSGTQCQCGSHVLPPVHIVKCKVDCRHQR